MPFNTIYQLAASRGTSELDAAATMLLTPDLIGYWLTGNDRRRGDDGVDDRPARCP